MVFQYLVLFAGRRHLHWQLYCPYQNHLTGNGVHLNADISVVVITFLIWMVHESRMKIKYGG